MSNRTLIEIDHDSANAIRRNKTAFGTALIAYLNHDTQANADELARYGVLVLGTRDSSGPYRLELGLRSIFKD